MKALLVVVVEAVLALSLLAAPVTAVRDCAPQESVLFLPLDERFTTRNAFLNLAATTSFCIRTPPTNLLPSWKYDCDIQKLHKWVDDNIDFVNTAIISSEMFLYGGLISSRTSNDSTAVIQGRLQKLRGYSTKRADLSLYVSNVVMRIPAYNGDFEEPWYWKQYGYNIYSYSFYLDKYNQLGDSNDLATSAYYKSLVPADAMNEFAWRRARNHNITVSMVAASGGTSSEFKYLYITLDDNAEYGFNIREAEELRTLVSQLNVTSNVPIYPGADEVQLTLLSKFSASYVSGITSYKPPTLAVVFRVPDAVNYIPNYEGQPMIDTLMQQIAAAGGTALVVQSVDDAQLLSADALLLVNNFENPKQGEAPNQPTSGDTELYAVFDGYIKNSLDRSVPIGFCDNRYSNGGDMFFVQYMQDTMASMAMKNLAYAGWNTDGNTIGTVVSNTLLLVTSPRMQLSQSVDDDIVKANQIFNSLRILEDAEYQSVSRQVLADYADSLDSSEENSLNLTPDLAFYERFSFKLLNQKYADIVSAYNLNLKLSSIYYPWNRTFEIGLLV
jgi:hypothetical protein